MISHNIFAIFHQERFLQHGDLLMMVAGFPDAAYTVYIGDSPDPTAVPCRV